MEEAGRRGKIIDGLWFLAWGIASSVWCLTAATQLSATFDEPVYLARGLDYWRTGSHQGLMKLGTMPLAVDLDTLPLFIWERSTGSRFNPESDFERLLPWARAGTLFFWWLLLAYGWRAGQQLAGCWGGRLAVALLACEPSLLAHATLATTDIAVSACLLAFTYHFRSARGAGWWRRVLVPGFWCGATVLAKASGLVFVPLCIFAVELERSWLGARSEPKGGRFAFLRAFSFLGQRSFWSESAQIGFLGMALAFFYCGSDWRTEPSFVQWVQSLPEGPSSRALAWLADHLCIFSNAGEGIVRQIKHNIRGHGTFLLGEMQPRSIWYYFPVALSIKLSPPLLLLPLGIALARPRALWNWAGAAAGMLLLFSLDCRVQIGIRLVLPLVTLGIVGLAGAAASACLAGRPLGRTTTGGGLNAAPPRRLLAWFAAGRARWLAAGLAAGLIWTSAAAIRVWPDGLCYTNELWGGTKRGYRCLSDSNYDWGQGLKELARWQRQHGLPALEVWYFGTDPSFRNLPMQDLPLHILPANGPGDIVRRVQGHYLAVSTTMLCGMILETPEHKQASAFLSQRRPVSRTPTFLIYDFTHEPGAQQ